MDVHCMCTLLANDRAIAGEYKKEVHIKYRVVSVIGEEPRRQSLGLMYLWWDFKVHWKICSSCDLQCIGLVKKNSVLDREKCSGLGHL